MARARRVEARRLLYALSIPLCGQDVCNRLLSAYPLQDLIALAEGQVQPTDLFAPRAEETLALLPGIGPEKAKSFVSWFAQTEHRAVVHKLLGELTVEQASTAATGDKCKGMTFVVTGDVHHYKNRSELKAYIEAQGGKVTGSVSKSTTFLINNDVTSTSSKNQKAHQLNIPIISEDDFVERFG